MKAALWEFLVFGLKEARACVFAGSFFLILAFSRHLHVPGLPRYDLILLLSLALQGLLVALKIETWDEVKVLSLFHLLGLGLELFKTHPAIHSWAYPEGAYAKIAGVPLYSGFMYAAVASYMTQAWRLFGLELEHFPDPRFSAALALAIYVNFFTHHFIWDLRWPLTALVVALFWRTTVKFRVLSTPRRMPLPLAFLLIGFFVWVAENIATRGGAWVYPDQRLAWRPVSAGKIHSWALLVILSFTSVADLKWLKARRKGSAVPSLDEEPASFSPLPIRLWCPHARPPLPRIRRSLEVPQAGGPSPPGPRSRRGPSADESSAHQPFGPAPGARGLRPQGGGARDGGP